MKLKRYLAVSFFTLICLFSCLFGLFGCSNNVFSEFGAKNSDDALLYDAQSALNAQLYDQAIDIITIKLSATGQQSVKSREILASAHAGKCGLNFIDYMERLSNATTGSTFVLVSAPFVGVPVAPASCLSALQTLDLIGNNAQRTPTQNAFAAILGMVLMGSATRLYTDGNPVNGDGAQDAANISCTLSDVQMNNVILGYAYMAINFTAVAAQIGGSSSTTISDSIAVCSSLGTSCAVTDPALISNQLRDVMRRLMNTSNYGIGAADGSSPLAIAAACL